MPSQSGGHQPRPRDLRRLPARLAHQPTDERGPHQVDEVVGHLAGDDLASETVVRRPLLPHQLHGLGREVPVKVVLGGRIVGQVGSQQRRFEMQFGVRHEDAQLGPRQRLIGLLARRQLVPGWKPLGVAVEQTLPDQVAHERPVVVHAPARAVFVERHRLASGLVVGQDEVGDAVGQALQQLVALVTRHEARVQGLVEDDLEVHFPVGEVDAAGVVQRIRVDTPAPQRVLDPRGLREPEVAAFPHHLGAEVAHVDAHGVVRGVARVGMVFRARLHVGADPAVPEQVDGRRQNGPDEALAVERHHVRIEAERDASLLGEVDRLCAPGHEHPARRQLAPVVVVPGRAAEVEDPLTLPEGGLGIGVGVDEDVAVVERRHEAGPARQEHPVPEDVPAHVADARHREGILLDVPAHLAEVPLHRLPRTAGGDPHGLVVVPVGAARGEGVVEPEAVLGRDGVGGVGEGRGALVGRDDQVGVEAVVAEHSLRRFGRTVEVVGDVQEPAHEGAVLLAGLMSHGFPVGERPEADEPALRPAGHDDRVFHHLGEHQSHDLGAEVVRAIRVADASSRHRRTPQVDPLHPRRTDPDFVLETALRHTLQPLAVELEGGVRHTPRPDRRGASPGPVVVRPHRRVDHGLKRAQRPVVGEGAHADQLIADPAPEFGSADLARLHARLRVRGARVEAGFEELEEEQPDRGVAVERGPQHLPAGHGPDLERVVRVRPQDFHLPPCHPGGLHQAVEAVVGRVPGPCGQDRLRQDGTPRFHIHPVPVRRLYIEAVDGRVVPAAAFAQFEERHGDHPESAVLKHRHEVRQDDLVLSDVHLEVALAPALRIVEEADRLHPPFGLHRLQLGDVRDRGIRIGRSLVFRREGARVVLRNAVGLVGWPRLGEEVPHLVEPRPGEARDGGLEVPPLDFGEPIGRATQIEVQACLVPRAHGQVIVQDLGLVARHQRRLELLAECARKAAARQHDHDGDTASQRVAPHRHEDLGGVVAGQDRADVLRDLLGRGKEKLLLRQRVEDRDDLLVVVRPLRHAFEDGPELLAQDRDVLGGLGVGLRREEAEETVFTRDRTVATKLLDTDIVHARAAVDRGLGVCLADDQKRARQRPLPHLAG